jgi:hypothetical protein
MDPEGTMYSCTAYALMLNDKIPTTATMTNRDRALLTFGRRILTDHHARGCP